MSPSDRLRIAFVADTLHSGSGGGIISGEYVVDRLRRDHEVFTVASDGDVVLRSFQLPVDAMQKMHFFMASPDRAALEGAFANVDVVHLQFPFWLSFAALHVAERMHYAWMDPTRPGEDRPFGFMLARGYSVRDYCALCGALIAGGATEADHAAIFDNERLIIHVLEQACVAKLQPAAPLPTAAELQGSCGLLAICAGRLENKRRHAWKCRRSNLGSFPTSADRLRCVVVGNAAFRQVRARRRTVSNPKLGETGCTNPGAQRDSATGSADAAADVVGQGASSACCRHSSHEASTSSFSCHGRNRAPSAAATGWCSFARSSWPRP